MAHRINTSAFERSDNFSIGIDQCRTIDTETPHATDVMTGTGRHSVVHKTFISLVRRPTAVPHDLIC